MVSINFWNTNTIGITSEAGTATAEEQHPLLSGNSTAIRSINRNISSSCRATDYYKHPPLISNSNSGNNPKIRRTIGLLFVALSALSYTLLDVFVKISGSGSSFSTSEVVFTRSIVQILIGLVAYAVFRINPLGHEPKVDPLLFVRVIISGAVLVTSFYGINHMPPSDAVDKHQATIKTTVLFVFSDLYYYYYYYYT